MPQLNTRKVVTARKGKSPARMVTSPGSLASVLGCESGRELVISQSSCLASKRKPEQPLSPCLQPDMLSSASCEQFAPIVPTKEKGETILRLQGKKAKGIQSRRAVRSSKGVVQPISDTAACEDCQAATTATSMCWEETGQGQQLFFSGTTLQNKFSASIERKEHSLEGLNDSGFQENWGSLGNTEIKFQIPSSEEKMESMVCLTDPEVLQPGKGTCSTEMKSTDSVMIWNMQISDLKKNLGTQQSLYEPKPQEEVDMLEKVDGCTLTESRKAEEQEKGKILLSKKGETSLVKPKPQCPRERGRSALLGLHAQCSESSKGAMSLRKRDRNALVSQQLQGLSGQEQPPATGKMSKCCMKEEQLISNPQKGADSLGESVKEKQKVVEQDSGTQPVKKLEKNQNRPEDPKEKEPQYSESPTVATLDGSQSRSFLCHPVAKKSGVQQKKKQLRTDQIKCLQSFSVTTGEEMKKVSVKCDAEHSRNALNHCNSLLCAREKNPFMQLGACSCINTFVKSLSSGTTSSYKLSGFIHVAQDDSKHVFPGGAAEQSDVNCSTSRMQNKRSPIKGGSLFNKEKNQNREECLSCCQSESSKCSRGKKWNIGRKPRKKKKIPEKSAVQNVFTAMPDECRECEFQTEGAVALSNSFPVLGLNHPEMTPSALCGHTSDLHTGSNTHEAQNVSVWRRTSTKLLAFEGGFKKTSACSVATEGENPSSVAHHSSDSDSLGVLAQVHHVADCQKSKTKAKVNKVNKKLQQFTCQRAVPMTGKKVWPLESCARTSEWVHKNHRSVSEGKRVLRAAFEESSDKNSLKAVENSAMTGNLRSLNLHVSAAEVSKGFTHTIIDPNTECLTSLETTESSSMDTYEASRMSNENVESPTNTERKAVDFNSDDVQEVKATSDFTGKQNHKNKGAVTKRNQSVTVQDGTSTDHTNTTDCSHEVSEANQTVFDFKLIKELDTGNLTKFKLPLCRKKPKSRKLKSVETETCSLLETLDSSSISRREESGEEAVLVNAEHQPLPAGSDTVSTPSMNQKADEMKSKDFQHEGSENEMAVLPQHLPLYAQPFLDGQQESSVPDFQNTECVLKSDFPDHSWNAVDHPAALQINAGGKSRGNLSQQQSKKLPDILEAYKDDVLVIDVIQDDPDLFGTNNEKELALADSENYPVKASNTSICIKDENQALEPEHPVPSENRDSGDDNFRHITIKESGMSNKTKNSCDWMLKAKDIKPHNSPRGSSPLGGVTEDFLEGGQLRELDELLKSFDVDEKFKFADGVPDVKQEKKGEAETSSDCKCKAPVDCELPSGVPLQAPKVLSEATVMKPQRNDDRFSGKGPLPPLQNSGDFEPWKMEKNTTDSHSVQQILEMIELPHKYCRFYFLTLRGCERANCWFRHVPEERDEKVCMAVLRTYIGIKVSGLLKRAVQIFVKYYREVIPGVDFALQVLNDLLISLLKNCLLQEVFQLLNVTVQINTLPAVDVLLKVFEHVASLNARDTLPTLISTFCKLIDAGMLLEFEHFDCIIKFLHQLQASSQELNTVLKIKSRFLERHFGKNWLFDFNLAVSEIQHCKEKSDWSKLGVLYVNARKGCEFSDDLQKLSLCVAEILTRDSEADSPGVPFCDFADAVIQNSQHNEADKIVIGRIGISVMYSYHRVLQWIKGRKVLDKLHDLQIKFTLLKGLAGVERLASRCQIVNKAAEIFLKTGSLDGATWVLRESEWTANTPQWPCDNMDILNRHNLLCTLLHKYLRKSLYRQAFEVLQNLPGFQNHSGTVDVSQYKCLFTKLINACFESKNLGVSCSAVDFMLSKNIVIDLFLLRRLITVLGRSSLWSKARTYYKSALSMGCYPSLQGNLYHKYLMIPSYQSEVEMLLAIEMFLVSNASDIQNSMATSQTLQLILKRCEDQTAQSSSNYQAAVGRLLLAARVSDPKLCLKHMTMTVNMEEVYILELTSALRWLQENMKWAGKVWLFQ